MAEKESRLPWREPLWVLQLSSNAIKPDLVMKVEIARDLGSSAQLLLKL